MGVLLIARIFAAETDRQDHRSSVWFLFTFLLPAADHILQQSKKDSRTLHAIDSSNIMTTSLF